MIESFLLCLCAGLYAYLLGPLKLRRDQYFGGVSIPCFYYASLTLIALIDNNFLEVMYEKNMYVLRRSWA